MVDYQLYHFLSVYSGETSPCGPGVVYKNVRHSIFHESYKTGYYPNIHRRKVSGIFIHGVYTAVGMRQPHLHAKT